MSPSKPEIEIVLALGGGGAKGMAHIGILRVLVREGFRVKAIAGTSIGGLIGALYAAGYTPSQIAAEVMQVDQRNMFGRKEGDLAGLLGTAGIEVFLERTLGDIRFEDLQIPFAVVAVDINFGEEIVIDSGKVAPALLATTAVPGVFPPREYKEYLLIDGGLSNPVPTSVARKFEMKFPIVAVPLLTAWKSKKRLQNPHLIPKTVPGAEFLLRMRVTQAFDVFIRAMDVNQRLLTELNLDIFPPDFMITPDVDHIPVLGEVEIPEIIKIGELAAEKAVGQMRRKLRRKNALEVLKEKVFGDS